MNSLQRGDEHVETSCAPEPHLIADPRSDAASAPDSADVPITARRLNWADLFLRAGMNSLQRAYQHAETSRAPEPHLSADSRSDVRQPRCHHRRTFDLFLRAGVNSLQRAYQHAETSRASEPHPSAEPRSDALSAPDSAGQRRCAHHRKTFELS